MALQYSHIYFCQEGVVHTKVYRAWEMNVMCEDGQAGPVVNRKGWWSPSKEGSHGLAQDCCCYVGMGAHFGQIL